MKRFLAVLTLTFALCLVSHAAELVGYWTGAWYETAVSPATVRPREAGQVDIYQYSDGTLDVDIYYDDGVVEAVGQWTRHPRTGRYTVTFNNGAFAYRGAGTGLFWSGAFSAVFPTVRIKGRWQAN